MVKDKIPNVVIPTIREEQFSTFIAEWKTELQGCHLIVVEDVKKKTEGVKNILLNTSGFTYSHYDWEDIDNDLKENAWIIPRQTDCVRSYGFLKALENNPLFILTLDDDVSPGNVPQLEQHYTNLFHLKGNGKYFSTMFNLDVRGSEVFPKTEEVYISHGCWRRNPDLSGHQQAKEITTNTYFSTQDSFFEGTIPKGCYLATCGMNLAWRPEITHSMYFGLQNKDTYGIDRCGDIWCGFYAKHYLDNIGGLIYTGKPYIIHNRASNVWSNIRKELNSDSKGQEFIDIIIHGKPTTDEYFLKLKKAYKIWEEEVSRRI